MELERLIKTITAWAVSVPGIVAIALVGSQARGTATAASDVDLVILAAEPARWLDDRVWLSQLGKALRVEHEDWGVLQSLRVFYADGAEVEFGIAPPSWAVLDVLGRPDPGTAEVVRGGMRILYDPLGVLAALQAAH